MDLPPDLIGRLILFRPADGKSQLLARIVRVDDDGALVVVPVGMPVADDVRRLVGHATARD